MQTSQRSKSPASERVEARATWMYAVLMLGGTGLMLAAMSYFLVVERRIWPLWAGWGATVIFFIVALIDVCVLRVVVSADSLRVRRAWGSRTVRLADLCELRYVKFEYIVKPREGCGLWIWLPRFITRQSELIDRLQREIARNVTSSMTEVTHAQRELSARALATTGVGMVEL